MILLIILPTACSSGGTPNADAGPTSADGAIASDASVDGATRDAAIPPPVWESASPCDHSGVRSVDVPVSDDPRAPLLRLRYRVFEARPGAPWVFVAPGGPGQALIAEDAERSFALGAVPTDEFTVVYTDARGSGCNVFSELDALAGEEAYSIDQVAADLAAIVAHEAPEEFYLFGASFGTAVVTAATHRLEMDEGPTPRRVVMEGVLGRSFDGFESYFSAFEVEWQRVRLLLSDEWRSALTDEPFADPNGYSRYQWGTFVAAQLILGDYPGQGHLLDYWLRGLSSGTPAAMAYVDGFMSGIPVGPVAETEPGLFTTIACRELWGSWRTNRFLEDGELRASGEDPCTGVTSIGYDAADYPSSAPVMYFQGPFDPTTTLEQAEYHLDVHRGTHRDFVSVPDAAHAPLTLGLSARGCGPAIWRAIRDEVDLAAVLEGCERSDETIGLVERDD